MKIIDWLLQGDPVIKWLTEKYLIEKDVLFCEDGYIGKYLQLYHEEEKGWGHGLYSPKWISDHYTLLELKEMEIDPQHRYYQATIEKLLKQFWYIGRSRNGKGRHFDVCVAAMLLSLASYGKRQDKQVFEIIDYLLEHRMMDGGWNCNYDAIKPSNKSSLHTTLSVLEAFAEYQKQNYSYRLVEIQSTLASAHEFILDKRLFRSKTTGEIIDENMTLMHYPPRWKYDAPRALLYFASIYYPYDGRMEEALIRIKDELNKGYLAPGPHYPNFIHFRLEKGKFGRFKTLRALRIIKHFDPQYYARIIEKEFAYN